MSQPGQGWEIRPINGYEFRELCTKEQRQREELEYLMRGDDEFFIPDWIRLKIADRVLDRYTLEPKP
jgi:hypothetical protein